MVYRILKCGRVDIMHIVIEYQEVIFIFQHFLLTSLQEISCHLSCLLFTVGSRKRIDISADKSQITVTSFITFLKSRKSTGLYTQFHFLQQFRSILSTYQSVYDLTA